MRRGDRIPRSMSVVGRLCCKSLFPLGTKNSPGCRRDFHVKMWGTSSPDDKLTGDLGNAFEAAEIGGRWSDRLLAVKLSSGDFGLLQQYRSKADEPLANLPPCLIGVGGLRRQPWRRSGAF